MPSFPVYDELKASVEKNPPPHHDKLCAAIAALPEEHWEFIYALILHHNEITQSSSFHKIPYGGTLLHGGKGVIYKAESLPPLLLKILDGYVNKVSTS